jgi:hypothetical protein
MTLVAWGESRNLDSLVEATLVQMPPPKGRWNGYSALEKTGEKSAGVQVAKPNKA